jgi:hypothetical protein
MALFLINSVSFAEVYKIKIVKKKVGKEVNVKGTIIYKVKKGDTLWGIVKKLKLPASAIKTIVKVNKIKNPNVIYEGQELKIPVGTKEKENRSRRKIPRRIKEDTISPAIKMVGGELTKDGGLILPQGIVNFSKYPKLTLDGRDYILDFNRKLSEKFRKELESLGMKVIRDKKKFRKLIEEKINSLFGIVKKDGDLILGFRDVLIYHYDYLSYNPTTGNRVVINLKGDTPPTLVKLLNAYDIEVIQPKSRRLEEKIGELKILKGGGTDKIVQLIKLLTGKDGKTTEEGIKFKDLNLFIAFDFIDPEKKVKMELKGYKVIVLSGNFLQDVDRILSVIPFVHKWIRFTVVEPPGSKGSRSKFYILGIWISTPTKDWFLIDSVDKVEEIPYLRSRGMNLIIY